MEANEQQQRGSRRHCCNRQPQASGLGDPFYSSDGRGGRTGGASIRASTRWSYGKKVKEERRVFCIILVRLAVALALVSPERRPAWNLAAWASMHHERRAVLARHDGGSYWCGKNESELSLMGSIFGCRLEELAKWQKNYRARVQLSATQEPASLMTSPRHLSSKRQVDMLHPAGLYSYRGLQRRIRKHPSNSPSPSLYL